MHARANGRDRVGSDLCELRANGVCEGHMRGEPAAEKRADAALRAVEELVGYDNVERRVFLFQAADRTRRNDPLDAEHLEAEYVRAEVQLGRKEAMARTVPCQKRDTLAAQRADQIGTRRIAERSLERCLFPIGQLGHVVQAAAADDTYLNSHESPAVRSRLPFAVCRSPFAVAVCRLPFPVASRPTVNAQATFSTYLFPSCSRMYPAAISGSCSKRMRY